MAKKNTKPPARHRKRQTTWIGRTRRMVSAILIWGVKLICLLLIYLAKGSFALTKKATLKFFLVPTVILSMLAGYIMSPVYQISEAVYWEALQQSPTEQLGVRWVIANRKDAKGHPEWSDTFYEVIRDGASRGNSRDFTYRYHHAQRYGYPEWFPILPYAHATRNGNWDEWFSISFDTTTFLLGYYSGFGKDPTHGATFYKVAGHKNSWFDSMIKSGKFCRKVVDLGAHIFYKLCRA